MIDSRLFTLAVVTVGFRIVPRLLRSYAVSSDAYYHILAAERIRESGYRVPARLRGLFFPGPYDYPPLFHIFLAWLPVRNLVVAERFISPIIDLAYVWLGYWFFARVITDAQGLDASHAYAQAFPLALLLSVSPALLYIGRGPRAYNANPRILSELLFAGFMVSVYAARTSDGAVASAIALVSIPALLLSSKFGAQVVVLVLPLFSAIAWIWWVMPLTAVGFLLALIPYKGHYLRVARGHIGHMSLFARLGYSRHPTMGRTSEWGALWHLIRAPHKAGTWYRLLCLHPVSTCAVRNPQLFLIAFGWYSGLLRWDDPTTRFLLAWTLSTLIVFAAVTVRPLLFLGEPERYVAYSVVGQYAILALLWPALPALAVLVLIVYSLTASVASQIGFITLNRKTPGRLSHGAELRSFFRGQTRIHRILPIGEGPYSLAFSTDQEVFYPCGNFQTWHTPVDEYLRIYERFLIPRADTLDETLRRYDIDTVVINKRNLPSAMRLPLKGLRLFENETFVVIDVTATSDVAQVEAASA